MQHFNTYTNDRGNRLFSVVSVGRKWTHGIWWEHPLKVSTVPNNITDEWEALTKTRSAKPTLVRMAREMYGRQSNMPKTLRKALFIKGEA
tara:strand:- start:341 stop:610 length:270 start_codon:yes stop_codon:yes gene_type:complete